MQALRSVVLLPYVVAAALGLVWIIGRIVYFLGYVSEARKRFPGFFIQSFSVSLLLLGAIGRIGYLAFFSNTAP